MADGHVEALRRARQSLVARRQHVALGIAKLPEGELDRVVRYAEYITSLQKAVEAIDRAVRDERAENGGNERPSG